MRVLISGSSGFLGSIIKNELINLNFKVIGINRTIGCYNNLKADLSTESPDLKGKYFDLVIHAAGKAHKIPKNQKEIDEFFNTNVIGTENLLKALEINKPKSLIFISSVAVYGKDSGEEINEDYPLGATDPYGKSKILAEQLIRDWGKKNDVIVGILRLPLIVGPRPVGNLNSMINAIRKGFYVRIGKGNTRRSMVLAEDVAKIATKVADIGGTYNLTDGHHPTFKEIEDKLKDILGVSKIYSVPLKIAQMMAKMGDVISAITNRDMPITTNKLYKITNSLTFSDNKARQLLNWQPQSVIKNISIVLTK